MTRQIQNEDLSLEVVHPDAAGIDIGNESHYVAVPPSRDSQPVRRFGCTTGELKTMGKRFTIFRALVDFSIYGESTLIHPRAKLSGNRSNFRRLNGLPS